MATAAEILILKALLMVADIDYITKAPDGKEVEEITKKEIHQALRARVVPQQIRLDKPERRDRPDSRNAVRPQFQRRTAHPQPPRPVQVHPSRPMLVQQEQDQMSTQEKEIFKTLSEELIGSRAAYLLDDGLKMLGKVPVSELALSLKGLTNVSAVIFDGIADYDIVRAAEASGVKRIIAMDSRVKNNETHIAIGTISEL